MQSATAADCSAPVKMLSNKLAHARSIAKRNGEVRLSPGVDKTCFRLLFSRFCSLSMEFTSSGGLSICCSTAANRRRAVPRAKNEILIFYQGGNATTMMLQPECDVSSPSGVGQSTAFGPGDPPGWQAKCLSRRYDRAATGVVL